MTFSKIAPLALVAALVGAGCGKSSEKAAETKIPPAASAPASADPAAQPAGSPSAAVPPAASAPAPSPAAAPEPPPPPKKYVIAAGTPIVVRTISDVNTKTNQAGTSFQATLQQPLIVDGHTLAKSGATVTGSVAESQQGGRVKGKASLTLTLSRLHLANGQNVAIRTNSVTQEAKSGTKKNLARTGVASGAGAAIGAIAGGGKGAAIGAGIGAGAGVATNVATRGPAAEIPPETILNFQLASDVVVTEK